jgi:hypothetical protein
MSTGILEKMMEAWQFIFEQHPYADQIMNLIIEHPEIVTVARFENWYHEAERATLCPSL